MNRRSFLKTLGLGAAVAVVAPELLLEPRKTYILPPAGGWRRLFAGNLSLFNPPGDIARQYREGALAFHPDAFSMVSAPLDELKFSKQWTDADWQDWHQDAIKEAAEEMARRIDEDIYRLYTRGEFVATEPPQSEKALTMIADYQREYNRLRSAELEVGERVVDRETGISIRFVREFDVERVRQVTGRDAFLVREATLRPELRRRGDYYEVVSPDLVPVHVVDAWLKT